MVAWTKAPRLAALAMVQPDAAGVSPFGPVSCHGVESPVALSGSAGTMMSQLTLATAAGAVAVGLADADADADAVEVGHGVAEAVTDAVGAAVAVVALADAVGVGTK
jgi:hypothetical protein